MALQSSRQRVGSCCPAVARAGRAASPARPLARLFPLALVAALWAAPPAFADAVGGSGLRFNGFGTVAAASVAPGSDWGFRREMTQSTHHDHGVRFDVDSRLGLQANWSPASEWELVAQVVLKPRAHEAPTQESLAWAFAAYRPSPDWTIRVGRTSPDLFLLADVRNVGFAYPWMRPSVEFYGFMPLSVTDGVDVTKQWNFGDTRLRAKAFTGRSEITIASTHDDGDTHVIVDSLGGMTLTADTGGLTIKGTLAEARTRPLDNASIVRLHDFLDVVSALPIPVVADQASILRDSFPTGHFITRYAAAAVSWDLDPWQLQAELSRTNGNFFGSNGWYGYASGAYRSGAATWFVMGARMKPTRDPLPSPDWQAALTPIIGPVNSAIAQGAASTVAAAYNFGREDQRTVSVGLRWDLGPQMAWKVQLDDVRVFPFGGGMWSYSTNESHSARVFSTGLDFIF